MKLAVFRACLAFLVLTTTFPLPVRAEESPVMRSLKTELDRSFARLKKAGDAPLYYLGYRLYDTTTYYISAEYGALTGEVEPVRRRTLNVDVRVGSHQMDNTHRSGNSGMFNVLDALSGQTQVYVPMEDNDLALRHALWLQTDRTFKRAQQQYSRVMASRDVNVTEEDKSNDFSREEPSRYFEPAKSISLNLDQWTRTTKNLSGIFRKYKDIYASSVVFTAKVTRRYLVNSEGTSIEDSRTDFRIYAMAQARAEDGMNLWLYDDIDATSLEELPDRDGLAELVKRTADNLDRLRTASVAQPYVGPAILRSRAAGVFFHEVFGHRMEGHRQKDEKEGRTFTKSVGQQVMSPFISVYDDPTQELMGDLHLNGTYKYDDEGVPAQRVTLVDKGVLKSFLMSRSPVEGFPKSNGHGRCAPSRDPVARMGNLIVESEKTVPYDQLRAMLIEEVKRQGKEYGLIFDDIAGGFTLTTTSAPQVYSLQPLVVTRVFADGRPDELVRGVKIVGTPLTALEKIICTSDKTDTFNGVCGAESGMVPVSASSPSLLVGTLEVELKDKRQDKPPLLPPPLFDGDGSDDEHTTGPEADEKGSK